jgi:ribonuclease BN (tRNA processing enzyme)
MSLSFIPLGIGDAFSRLHYSSCLAVNFGESWIIVDCPHPIRKMLHEASHSLEKSLDVGDIEAVVLTHLHGDHCSGLEGMAFFSHFYLQRQLKVFGHPLVAEHLWDGILRLAMEPLVEADGAAPEEPRSMETYLDLKHLDEKRSVEVGPFHIECRRTIHHIPTTALRISAGGRCLGYSADTSFDPTLIDWLSDADLIIHETNLGPHTPYDQLQQLPEEIRQKMRLIHTHDEFDRNGSEIQALVQGELTIV